MAGTAPIDSGVQGRAEHVTPVDRSQYVLPVASTEHWERWLYKCVPCKPWTNYTIVWPGESMTDDDIQRRNVFIATDGTTYTFLVHCADKFAAVPKTSYSSLFVVTEPDQMFVQVGIGRYVWLPTCPDSLRRSA